MNLFSLVLNLFSPWQQNMLHQPLETLSSLTLYHLANYEDMKILMILATLAYKTTHNITFTIHWCNSKRTTQHVAIIIY